ncbi:MAG TPA: MFS transporter [Spirochaetia bacterium]|nr:MFS transporter [Spirochaetia bacterium]
MRPEPAPELPSIRLSTLVFSVYIPTFLFATGWAMVVPVIPFLARHLGATIGVAGLIVTMRGVGTLVMDLPSGMLVATLGNHRTLLLSSLGVVVTAVLTGLTHSIAALLVLTLFLGGFQSSWMMSRLNYVRQAVGVHQRGRALSFIGGTFRVGSFVGPIVGGFVGRYLGLSDVFLVQGAVGLAALVLILTTRGHFRPEEPHNTETSMLRRIGAVASAQRRPLMTGGLVVLALMVLRSSRQILIPLWGSSIGLDVGSVGLVLGLSSGIDMLMFYPAGLIMDRLGRKWAMIPCLVILSLSFALLPLAVSFTSLLVVTLIAGLGNGFGSGIVMTLGADFAPDGATGEFLGLWRLVGDVGTAAGPAAVGAIGEALSLGAAPLFVALVGVLGAIVMYFFTSETRRIGRRSEPPADAGSP